jgi:hypothetical protein
VLDIVLKFFSRKPLFLEHLLELDNMSSVTEERRTLYMNQLRDFMITDIESGINKGLNFLVALGLSTYTEILGGLCYGNLQSNYKSNYDRFIKNYFDKKCGCEYMKVDKRLSHLGGLYGVVRSELVHRYLLTGKGFIGTYSPVILKCAVIYTPGQVPEIQFGVKEYCEHFKCAFGIYYNDLIVMKDVHLVENFNKAVTRADLI